MALKKSIGTLFGVDIPDAYHRIEFVMIGKSKQQLEFRVRTYKDSGSESWITDAVYACEYDINGSNPIAQAYAYLKTLPEFVDAMDC